MLALSLSLSLSLAQTLRRMVHPTVGLCVLPIMLFYCDVRARG